MLLPEFQPDDTVLAVVRNPEFRGPLLLHVDGSTNPHAFSGTIIQLEINLGEHFSVDRTGYGEPSLMFPLESTWNAIKKNYRKPSQDSEAESMYTGITVREASANVRYILPLGQAGSNGALLADYIYEPMTGKRAKSTATRLGRRPAHGKHAFGIIDNPFVVPVSELVEPTTDIAPSTDVRRLPNFAHNSYIRRGTLGTNEY